MAKKTINQALRDVFLGLGGDASALADNTSVSDYIEDLESAIKNGTVENAVTASKDPKGKNITSYVAGASLNGTDLSLYDGNIEPVGEPIDLSGIGGGDDPLELGLMYMSNNITYTYPEGYDHDTFISAVRNGKSAVAKIFYMDYTAGITFANDTILKLSNISDASVFFRGVGQSDSTDKKVYDVVFRMTNQPTFTDAFILNALETT